MLRRTPAFTALDPALVSSGLQPDKHLLQKTLWARAENVTFFGGKVRRRVPPVLAVNIGPDPIRGISQQQATDGVRWLWAASGGLVRRWFAAAPDTILDVDWQEDQTSALQPTFFDFTHYGNWTIINSGTGPAQIVKALEGSDPPPPTTDFGDAPSDVVCFMKKLSFIMAFGYGARGTRVGWSDSADVEDWTATPDNSAGAMSIDDFNTRIRAAANLGQSVAVYSEDQMALVTYIGAPFYFGQKTVLDGIGAIGKMAVASDGKNNLGVGRGGIWWTDSNSYRYIDEGALHDYLQDEVNWEQGGKIVATRNDYTGCFEFFFPMRESNVVNEGWSFDPRTGGWTQLEGVSSKDERRLFQKPVIGSNAGDLLLDNGDVTARAVLALETKPLLMQLQTAEGFADAHTSSKIDEVDLLLKESSNVEFRLGSQQEAHLAFEYTPWMECLPESRTYKMPALADGVYWKLEFRSTADEWTFNFQGFMFFGAVEGTKRTFS